MKAAAVLALCLAVSLAAPAAAAPGDLDRSFGRGGVVRTEVGGTDFATGLTLLPDARILAWGRSDVSPPFDARMGPGNENFALARYTAAGLLDSSFGSGGLVTWDIGGRQDGIMDAFLQRDGKLLVAGWTSRPNAPFWHLVLARYDAAGRLDAGFGDGGRVTLDVGHGYTSAPALVRQLGDDRILLAAATGPDPPATSTHLALLRFLGDGRPDPDFGEGGRRVVPFHGGTGRIARFDADSAGRVVALGATTPASTEDLVVARYTPAGESDPSFGDGGHTVISRGNYDYPDALLLDRAGGVLVSGQVDVAGRGMHLTRLGPDGRLDAAFGTGGSSELRFPADALALDGRGRILVGDERFRLARYSRAGALDARFVRGRLPPYLGGNPLSLAVRPDGRIVAVGYSSARPSRDPYGPPPSHDFAVARFHGGDDFRRPRIRLAGGRPRGCLGRRVLIRVRVRDRAFRGAFTARLHGRPLAVERRGGARYAVPVPLGRLRPGLHRLALVARDASDNRTVLRVRLRRCR